MYVFMCRAHLKTFFVTSSLIDLRPLPDHRPRPLSYHCVLLYVAMTNHQASSEQLILFSIKARLKQLHISRTPTLSTSCPFEDVVVTSYIRISLIKNFAHPAMKGVPPELSQSIHVSHFPLQHSCICIGIITQGFQM